MTDDRRRDAALAACEGVPTEALERGLVKEAIGLAQVITLADGLAECRGGEVVIPEMWWRDHIRGAIHNLNRIVEPDWQPGGGSVEAR